MKQLKTASIVLLTVQHVSMAMTAFLAEVDSPYNKEDSVQDHVIVQDNTLMQTVNARIALWVVINAQAETHAISAIHTRTSKMEIAHANLTIKSPPEQHSDTSMLMFSTCNSLTAPISILAPTIVHRYLKLAETALDSTSLNFNAQPQTLQVHLN